MNIGMLWFDNSNKPLDEKIRKAAEFYRNKYGASPTLCFVRQAEEKTVDGIRVLPSSQVLPNHVWIGVETQH